MIRQLIRRFKGSYAVYNFFHRRDLAHNAKKYRELGLRKFWFSPVSSKDFQSLPAERQKSRVIHPEAIQNSALYQSLDPKSRASLDQFDETGFAVFENFLPSDLVDAINAEMDQFLKNGVVRQEANGKIMFAIHASALLRSVGQDPRLLQLLSILLDGDAMLFQSINFLRGSEQPTHSDSIHMTTYPLGGLLGVWVALEDIHPDNGPLHYYPGSHKLPYYLNSDYGNEGSYFFLGPKDYTAYEDFIAKRIEELGLKKEILCIPKGSVMIWHANLFHGGDPHRDKNSTRKSVVFHYFDRNSICYHEITQRPALIRSLLNHESNH
jgi:phytanoyl-CoA hydroxylase